VATGNLSKQLQMKQTSAEIEPDVASHTLSVSSNITGDVAKSRGSYFLFLTGVGVGAVLMKILGSNQ